MTLNYEQMRSMEKTHVCAECEAPLVTTWTKDGKGYALVCGRDRSHQGYQRMLSVSEVVSRGEADKLLGPKAQEEMERLAQEGLPAISLLPTTDLATGKALVPVQLGALISFGKVLGLKPWLGHVVIFYSKPYISIDGYYYLNNKREKPFSISSRPMTTEERKDHKLGKEDYGYIAEGKDRDGVAVANGIGIATKDEIESKSLRDPGKFRAPVVHDHPQRMAEKRAELTTLKGGK